MATRRQKFQVGLFLLACVLLIAGGLIILTGLNETDSVVYRMEFEESVLGLYEGGVVEYRGLPVGTVQSMRVTEEDTVAVTVTIDPDKVTLREGVMAQLTLYSLATGTKSVSLEGGQKGAARLQPGSSIPVQPSTIAALSNSGEELLDNVLQILEVFRGALKGMEEGQFTAIVAQGEGLIADARGFLDEGTGLVTDARTVIERFEDDIEVALQEFTGLGEEATSLAGDLEDFLAIAEEKLAAIDTDAANENVNTLLESLTETSDSLQRTLAELEGVSGNLAHDVDNLEYSLRTSLTEAARTFEALRALTEEIQRDPAAIFRGPRPTEVE